MGHEILQPYRRESYWQRHRRLSGFLLATFALFYGLFFGVTNTVFIVQLLIPYAALIGIVLWCLPEIGRAPRRLIEKLFFAFFVALLCWPDYLAIALPGLPWITATRLVATPLALVFLIGLSQSKQFREELTQIINAVPAVWKLITAFCVIALVSTGVSHNVGNTLSKYSVALLYWVMIFFVACYVFTIPGKITYFAKLLWSIVVFVCLIGVVEARHSVVPWAGHIPSILKIEDPTVINILNGSSRATTGIYRVQSKFTTPLGLAEYLVYAMPFVLHLGMTARSKATRLGCFATIPLMVWTILKTDSRLGMVGFFLSILMYVLFWGVRRWRSRPDSLFGPAAVLAFPTLMVGFLISTFLVGRLRNVIWGTGAQSFSSQARKQQVAEGLPKLLTHPWGFGFGQGATTLGFTNPAGVLTIDSYYLSVALEIGVIGFLIYFGTFLWAIFKGSQYLLRVDEDEMSYLGPCVMSLMNFVVVKSIFSQVDNHSLAYAILGAVIALIYRDQQISQGRIVS